MKIHLVNKMTQYINCSVMHAWSLKYMTLDVRFKLKAQATVPGGKK